MVRKNLPPVWCALLLAASLLAAGLGRVLAADSQDLTDEAKLIAVLRSDAAPAEKAITCKRLSVYGTSEAVPALAPLLLDRELSSWARIALEAIPGPAADAALRDALDKAQGRVLIGVINSIAVRRDGQAVDGLAVKLKADEADVAAAAAVALGRIGGAQPAKILLQALSEAPAVVRPAMAEGCILCAEQYLGAGRPEEAVKLYDAVRQANLPRQKLLEATRGAILARGFGGIGLLIEQLESPNRAQLGIGLRVARELPGREVTDTLALEIKHLSPDRQPLLLLAVADRNDAAVLPAVAEAARTGPKALRITALGLLARLGNVSCVPLLLEAATQGDPELAQAAQETLTHLPGQDVDADLLGRLPQAAGRTREVLIVLAGQRQIDGALAAILPSLEDADAGIRAAAVQAIGIMGEDKQVPELVQLLQKTQSAPERAGMEKSLLSICGRWGTACVPHLMPLMQSRDVALRTIGLHGMAVAGGPEALAALRAAITDPDETIQDEAVRTLSTWPNNWPEDEAAAEALLALAKSDTKISHHVLGVRGYLQYVRGDRKLNNNAKVAKIDELLPAMQRPEEKRLAIGVLGAIRTARSLELLTTLASDPAVAEDACSAIVNLSGRNMQGATREQRRQALETVVQKSKNDATKRRAQEALTPVR
jgi:HEAT repeat protein